jgi:hypothetical protein
MKLDKKTLGIINKMVNQGINDDDIIKHLLFINTDIKTVKQITNFTDLIKDAILFTDLDDSI